MKIWYAPNTRAVRIVWLCNELGLSYELETFRLGDPAMRAPGYLAVHPLGRVPALRDGGATIFESGAIVQYLLAKYGGGRLAPDTESPDFPAWLQWLHFAEGTIMPHVNIVVVETVLLPPERRNRVNVDRSMRQLARMLGAVERALDGREFLAGAFGGADIMTGHACIVARRLGADVSDKPNVRAYTDRLEARPALAAAWDAGTPAESGA